MCTPATTAPLCSFYMRNACTRGDQCRFSHSIPQNSPFTQERTYRTPCSFYLLGNCKNGVQCRFLHPKSVSQVSSVNWRDRSLPGTSVIPENVSPARAEPLWRTPDDSVNGPRRDVAPCSKLPVFGPCRYYIRGRCTKGDTCPYPHPRSSEDAPLVPPPTLARPPVSGTSTYLPDSI